jgi:hypothetical protein
MRGPSICDFRKLPAVVPLSCAPRVWRATRVG